MQLRTLLLSVLLLYGCNGFFFYPSNKLQLTPTEVGLEYEDVYFSHEENPRLHAWFLKAEEPVKGSILFLHGNAGNIASHLASVYWLPDAGYEVFALDYRGYGLSQGTATPSGVMKDAEAALHELLKRKTPEAPLIIFGQSLGAVVALNLAAHAKEREVIAAVTADSAFSSFRAIAREKLNLWWLTSWLRIPLGWTITDRYSALEAAPRISPIPVLFIHGTADDVVPVHHSEELFEQALSPKALWTVEGVGHIGVLSIQENRSKFLEYLAGVTYESEE